MSASHSNSKPNDNALFEVTFSFNPRCILRYIFNRNNGALHHVTLIAFSLLWILMAATSQLSLAEYFPNLPLHPMPVVAAFLATKRNAVPAVLAAFAMGIVFDSLAFNSLGPTSIILAIVVLTTRFIHDENKTLQQHPAWTALVLGCVSVLLYNGAKLTLHACPPTYGDILPHVPLQLIAAPVIAAICIAPILFNLMTFCEWLLGIRQQNHD